MLVKLRMLSTEHCLYSLFISLNTNTYNKAPNYSTNLSLWWRRSTALKYYKKKGKTMSDSSWRDITTENAEELVNFYQSVMGWKKESIDMGQM